MASSADRRAHAPGAYAICRTDPPQLFLAENAAVISRLIALQVVAATDPDEFAPGSLDAVRSALLEERWADAVLLWITTTGIAIDIYEEFVPVFTDARLDAETASLEIRMSAIFGGTTAGVDPPG